MAGRDNDPERTKLEGEIRDLGGALSSVLIMELNRALAEGNVTLTEHTELLPYITSSGMLAVAGLDIDRDGIRKIMESLDMETDEDLLNMTAKFRYRNHLVYVCAKYFLMSIGREGNLAELLTVMRALGIHPDAKVAQFVIDTYNSMNAKTSSPSSTKI